LQDSKKASALGQTVSQTDKPAIRGNLGGTLRHRDTTARLKFVETDVSPEEYDKIWEYCLKHKISVSQFLADLILEDAHNAKTPKAAVRIQPDLEFSSDEYEKLELLADLQDKSVTELIRDLIQPHLDLRKMHGGDKTKKLRFYLSDREHQIVMKHLEKRGTTARKYVSFLAIRTIAKSHKGRKP
jgi:hypothetical protein